MAGRRGRCKECGAEMIWATMVASGKPNPLDPDPVDPDTIQAQKGQIAYNPKTGNATSVTGQTAAGIRRWTAAGLCTVHVSHWATCPERDKVRMRVDAAREAKAQ